MSSSRTHPASFFPAWRQPIGAWRARGASWAALRVGLGLALRDTADGSLLDREGYSLWHYWANSPAPAAGFSTLLKRTGVDLTHHLSIRGEHPWHYLLFHGQREALTKWVARLGLPSEPPAPEGGDTFAHCAAWSGDPRVLDLFQHCDVVSINASDGAGMTPLMVAVHRGGMPLVRAFVLAGADPMLADSQGRNALHHAAQYGDLELLAFLEDIGGDASVRNAQGLAAQDIARMRRQISPQDLTVLREHWDKRRAQRLPF